MSAPGQRAAPDRATPPAADGEAPSPDTLGGMFLARPDLFDVDMAHHVCDTLAQDAGAPIADGFTSNPSHLLRPTVLAVDESRAGAGRVVANHMGLFGPVAALPAHYTSAVIAERKRRSHALFDFLDLFAGHLRRLFVRAHRKYRLASLFQAHGIGAGNKVTAAIFASCGFCDAGRREAMAIGDNVILYYAGFFADQRRNAINLERMIADFLGQRVKVTQFSARQLPIARDEQTRIGAAGAPNAILGRTAVAGATCANRTGAIRVTIGPLDYPRYLALMPDRGLYGQLVEMIGLYCGPGVAFDIQLILARAHVPPTRLDANAPVGRLGWDCWALNGEAAGDSDETVFDPAFVKPVAAD